MQTGFEEKSTEILVATRERVIAGVMAIGARIAAGETVGGESIAMVPIQALMVAGMDAELLRRGVAVPAPPWE